MLRRKAGCVSFAAHVAMHSMRIRDHVPGTMAGICAFFVSTLFFLCWVRPSARRGLLFMIAKPKESVPQVPGGGGYSCRAASAGRRSAAVLRHRGGVSCG